MYDQLESTIDKIITERKPFNNSIIRHIADHGDKFSDNCNPIIKAYYNLLKNQIDLIKLHFEYLENGKGYGEAKEDFIKKISVG